VHANTAPADHNDYIRTMLTTKSRNLISSGRDEPVADKREWRTFGVCECPSERAPHGAETAFTSFNLFFQYVHESVIGGSTQVPLYQVIQNSGHEYGDFVFIADQERLPAPASIHPCRPRHAVASAQAVERQPAARARLHHASRCRQPHRQAPPADPAVICPSPIIGSRCSSSGILLSS